MGGVGDDRILGQDDDVKAACEALREHVDNINRRSSVRLVGSVYKARVPGVIDTVGVGGIEIGYRMQDYNTFMRRQIFIKVPGYRIEDLSDMERERILTAIFEVFLVPGADLPEIAHIAPGTMLLQQDFVPLYLKERSPGLVSIAGGVDYDG